MSQEPPDTLITQGAIGGPTLQLVLHRWHQRPIGEVGLWGPRGRRLGVRAASQHTCRASGACVGRKGSEHVPGRERKKTLGCLHQQALPAGSLKDKVEPNSGTHCDPNVTITSHLRRSPRGVMDRHRPELHLEALSIAGRAFTGSARLRTRKPFGGHGLKSQRSQMAPGCRPGPSKGAAAGRVWPLKVAAPFQVLGSRL